jgi:hypothetical protein
MQPSKSGRGRQALQSACIALFTTLVSLAAIEIALRLADLRILREASSERSLSYRFDAELGWMPIPNSSSVVTTARSIHARHNSLGFRDIEFAPGTEPVMLFMGDSFVWGVDAEANERFTDLLRTRISNFTVVNAGVSGFGTDQEYLLLQRIWPSVRPAVVVLIFCTDNDRKDNSLNERYDGYQKPYFVVAANGMLELRGQPVPYSRQVYIKENWLVRHLWLARVAVSAYTEMRYPKVERPDPTEQLVGKFRDFVATHGAKLIIGLQLSDNRLMQYLRSEEIPFVTFEGAEAYSDRYGSHWTPEGHRLVAERLFKLLSENNISGTNSPSR